MSCNRVLAFILVSLISVVCLQARAEKVEPWNIPIEHFFKNPQFTDMVISPDGNHIAVIYDDKDSSTSAAILDVSLTKVLSSFNFGEYQRITDVMWARNDRVIISYQKYVGFLDDRGGPAVWVAYDLDGSNGRQLNSPTSAAYSMVSLLPEDPEKILVNKRNYADFTDRQGDFSQIPAKLFTIDIEKGKEDYIAAEPPNVNQIIADTNGVPRLAFGYNETRGDELGKGSFTAYVKRTPTSEWEQFQSNKFVRGESGEVAAVRLLGFSSDNSLAYISTNYDAPLGSIYSMDMQTLEFTRIFTPEKVTIGSPLSSYNGGLEGFSMSPDYNTIQFLSEDSEMRKVMLQMYASFGVTDQSSNIRFTSVTSDGNKILFNLSSDKDPGVFYLFNRGLDGSAPEIRLLSESKPEIDPSMMASLVPFEFQSRDGINLNGYYMLPTFGEAPFPMVQIIHGGPHGPRDYWGWNREAQFLASRGYAVVMVNFRGSGGYGVDFERSGYQNWGGKMTNDKTDATMWMVEQGFADQDRMCVYGGSYGGYGTLQSVVREPDLYKCGIGYVGVYSLPEMKRSGDIPRRASGRKYLDMILGEDEAKLREYSPALNVEKIKAELFIAHGSEDLRVPMSQYEVLSQNLKRVGKPYISMVRAEGHGYSEMENVKDFYSTMEQFLADNLKK